jgi:hypothetical protein
MCCTCIEPVLCNEPAFVFCTYTTVEPVLCNVNLYSCIAPKPNLSSNVHSSRQFISIDGMTANIMHIVSIVSSVSSA